VPDPAANSITQPATAAIQHAFVTILPRIVLHARISFRHVACNDTRENAVAETVALTWKWFVGLVTKAVKSGRRLCGQEKAKDILSPLAQSRSGFTVSPFPEFSTLDGNSFDEALQDNTQTPVPDQVSFRVDFPAWLSTRTERDRLIISSLMLGERTLDVSQKYRVSQPRISQLRREYLEDWCAFCEPAESVVV